MCNSVATVHLFVFASALFWVPSAQKHSRIQPEVWKCSLLGTEPEAFWDMKYLFGFSGTHFSLLLCGRPVVVCRCVYMYGCLHEFVRACMYMYVCVLVSGTVGDILFWLLWKDDEWHFALQLFLNLKFPF